MINIINDTIFNSKEKYIAQQCNCLTKRAAHLSLDIFTKYPYANIYKDRIIDNHIDKPGNIIIRGNGKDKRYIINMLGQYYPGIVKYPNSKLDGFKARTDYFFSCLQKISEIDNLKSIAFPYGIGCGAAGGDWELYYKLINKFYEFVKEKADVYIYRLGE